MRVLLPLSLIVLLLACGDDGAPVDAGLHVDGETRSDARVRDAAVTDAVFDVNSEDSAAADMGCVCGDGLRCNEARECVADCPSDCGESCPQGCFSVPACEPGSVAPAFVANVETAGVAWFPGPTEGSVVYYHRMGEAFWMRAHAASHVPDGRMVTSLFGLLPDTDYEVQVRGDSSVLCGGFRTLRVTPENRTTAELYVSPSGSDRGDGTFESPFRTIQAAVDHAAAGTDIHIAAGVYHEEVRIERAFLDGQYLRLLGDPGAVLDGSDPDMLYPDFAADGAVWSVSFSGDPRYLMRDGARLYHFESLDQIRRGEGHGDTDIAEGFFADGTRLYVRLDGSPAGHDFSVPALNTGIALNGAAWVWIEGLEIRGFGEGEYGKGVDIRASDHVVVRRCHVHDIPSLVWIRRGSASTRIEDNVLHQSATASWPWRSMKATDHENSAVAIVGGEQTIVARNSIYAIFNGIYAGSFSDDQNAAIASDVDVYNNRLRNIQDDGLEPEGACVNVRYRGNIVDGVHNGVSLAPITYGPTWILRNRFTQYDQSGFKLSNGSSGSVFLYHNTSYTDRTDQNGMSVSGPFSNVVFRNNIVRGTRYALEMSRDAEANDLDYDNWYTSRGAPVIKWDNQRYSDVSEWCASTGLECHGPSGEPMLVDPAAFQFAPTAASQNVDAAERILGINDHYVGTGPDIGYVEAETAEIPALDVAPFVPVE